MKTPQKLDIEFRGLLLSQDMHTKMLYVKELEASMLRIVGDINKSWHLSFPIDSQVFSFRNCKPVRCVIF